MKKLVVGILAHVDAGKTTLSEALLYRSGALRRLGRVDHQDAFLDTDAMERERGITIFSKQRQMCIRDSYHILDNQAEALEFAIHDYSPVVGVPLSDLKLKHNLLVCCLARSGKIRIPRGQDTIQIGDNVIIVTTHKGLRDICDILEK